MDKEGIPRFEMDALTLNMIELFILLTIKIEPKYKVKHWKKEI